MIEKLKSLKQHEGFMKYFKNTSWLFAEKILRMVVGLFVGIWIAKYLGPDRYGLLSYAQSFVGLFSAVATLGLDGIVVRELVKDENRRDELIGTAFYLKLMGAFLVLVLLGVAVNFTSDDTQANSLIFIIASATIFQSFNVVDMYFQSKVMSKYVVYANVISLFISSSFKIMFILSNAPLIAFAWVVLFDSLVLASGYIYFFLKNTNFSIKKLRFKRETAILLSKDSWPLLLTGIMISIYAQLDQVMLKNIIDDKEVGLYAAAFRLNVIITIIPSVLLISLTPAIVNAKKISEVFFLKRLQFMYNAFTLYAYIAILCTLFFSSYIVKFTYGIEYEKSAIILNIIVFSNIFSFLGAASSRWYMNTGYEIKILYRNLFGVFVNIVGNILFIPLYGAIGAALTTILAQVSANLLFDLFDKNTLVTFHQKIKALFFLDYFIMKEKNESN